MVVARVRINRHGGNGALNVVSIDFNVNVRARRERFFGRLISSEKNQRTDLAVVDDVWKVGADAAPESRR